MHIISKLRIRRRRLWMVPKVLVFESDLYFDFCHFRNEITDWLTSERKVVLKHFKHLSCQVCTWNNFRLNHVYIFSHRTDINWTVLNYSPIPITPLLIIEGLRKTISILKTFFFQGSVILWPVLVEDSCFSCIYENTNTQLTI